MRAKKWEILTALAVGCAAGWLLSASSGCAFAWMAVARADDSATFTCDETTKDNGVFFDLPDDAPETFARLAVVVTNTADGRKSFAANVSTTATSTQRVRYACPLGAKVTFVLR